MIIGSHVKMAAPHYILGSVEEALSYKANALMLYTGAPQNTLRKPIRELMVPEARKLMEESGLSMENMIVHAPYIINLANSVKPDTYDLAKRFLREELDRVTEIGAKYLVLHPGSYVEADLETGIEYIINGLNEILKEDDSVVICLETMAGKGHEVGFAFEQLKQIRDGITYKDRIAFCLDTCHIHDAGYDVADFDKVLEEFDSVLGLENLKVIHLNDSKNVRGARKDRHENLGKGNIGFETLHYVANHPKLDHVAKILETPWVDGKAPYAEEIAQLRGE